MTNDRRMRSWATRTRLFFGAAARRRALAVTIAAATLGACAPPPQRKPLEMEPIGTVPNVERLGPVDDGSVTSPNSAGQPPADSCSGAEFDDVAQVFAACATSMPKSGEIPSLRDKLEVKIASPATVPAGGRVEMSAVLRNKGAEELVLYFTGEPSPRADVEAYDAKNRRADLPAGRAPKVVVTRETKVARVTLQPGGTARVRFGWEAVKTKWAPDKAKTWEGRGAPRTPAGPLPHGKYTLKVLLPLLGDVEPTRLSVEVVAS